MNFKISIRTALVALIICSGLFAQAQTFAVRGLRVDTSYFYTMYPALTQTQIANKVVSDAKAAGVNTLFLYAYNSVYGALYPTTYAQTIVESGYGRQNIFKEITTVAKTNGLKVVAVVPVNNFKTVWDANPAWRAKNKAGNDYIPFAGSYMLSAWHPDFRIWLKGFYENLLSLNPDIDGLEAVEPTIDFNWAKDADYNAVANQKFQSLYPAGILGDQSWLNFRAKGMTDLISILNNAASLYSKNSYLVQTWPAKPDGSLFSSAVIKDNIGLDFDGILSLTGTSKLKFLMAELMWQQWAAEYGPAQFPVSWTTQAAKTFISYVNGRSVALIHIEISPFTGAYGSITPTTAEFANTLLAIKDLNTGIDVYDYNQIATRNAWAQLTSWGTGTTTTTPTTIQCGVTTRAMTSLPNRWGVTQICKATLPISTPSATAVAAAVTNAGSYYLVCQANGSWASVPTSSYCPAPSAAIKL